MELLIFIFFMLFMFARAVVQQQRRQAERARREGRREVIPPVAPEESSRPWWWDEPLPPMWPQDLESPLEPPAPEPAPVAGAPAGDQVPGAGDEALAPAERQMQAGAGRREALPRTPVLGRCAAAEAVAFDPRELRRAVIMAEILAPPLSRRRRLRYWL